MEDHNTQEEVETDDELAGLIRQALEDRVAGAEPRRDRAAFLSYVRARARDQAMQDQAVEDTDLFEPDQTTQLQHRNPDLGQAIAQLTGPIINLMR